MTSDLLDPLFSSAPMRNICGDKGLLGAMLDFEAALAHAESRCGIIPDNAAGPIARACDPSLYDAVALGHAARQAGNLAIPLVKALTKKVAEADPEAARYVHWGSTSQDVIDTATMLQMRAALDVLIADAERAADGFFALAKRHRATPSVARTWLQHALPMPFGLKLAGYGAALRRAADRLRDLRAHGLALQFGGAGGTLASLGERGIEVGEALASELDLPLPDAPWHTHRDRIAAIAAALGILAGTCGKIGRDMQLMMQTDVGEAFEPAAEGRGGSSALPHKRNPVAGAIAVAAATMAPNLVATILAAQVQDFERSAGPWHAEWPSLTTLLLCVSGALEAVCEVAGGMEIDEARMRENLGRTRGLVMTEAVSTALAQHLGKSAAHHLIEEASRHAIAEGKPLHDILAADRRVGEHLTPDALKRLFEPMNYQGAAQAFIDRQSTRKMR